MRGRIPARSYAHGPYAATRFDGLAQNGNATRLPLVAGKASRFAATRRCATASSRCNFYQMDSIAQIKKAILQIEEMLYEKIPIQDLAHQVFASRFHFHRLFRKVTGTTVYQYILCRKLTEAAKLLLETDKPIGVIAAAVGFESHEGFCRAFKKRIGASPLHYRKGGQRFSLMPALDLDTGSLRCGVLQEPREIVYPGVLLAGVQVQGYSRNKASDAWFYLLSQVESIPYISDQWDSYGILRGSTWDHDSVKYCYTACKQVTQMGVYANGIESVNIPAGIYLQALVRGRRKDLTDFYKTMAGHSMIRDDAWMIEYQDEHFLAPEISPRMVLISKNECNSHE